MTKARWTTPVPLPRQRQPTPRQRSSWPASIERIQLKSKGGAFGVELRPDNPPLRQGNKRRSTRIYNKHKQSGGAARAGTVRWEARLRTKFLRSRNITTVFDVTPVALHRLRSEAWSWSGMGGPIYGPAAGLIRLRKGVEGGEISRAQAASILGNLSLDIDVPRTTRSRHRRILKSLGLPYTAELACKPGSNKPSSVYAVDFRTGDITLTPYP